MHKDQPQPISKQEELVLIEVNLSILLGNAKWLQQQAKVPAITQEDGLKLLYEQMNTLSKNTRMLKNKVKVRDFVSNAEKKLSQEDIADFCNTSVQRINSSVFLGKCFPDILTLIKVAQCFTVYLKRTITVSDLLDEHFIEKYKLVGKKN